MIYSSPGSPVEIVADGYASGLVTVGYRLRDNQGADTIARTTAGVVEDIAGSGIYRATLTAPTAAGQYTVTWDNGATPPVFATEELVVTSSSVSLTLPSGSDLCTLADVRQSLELPAAETSRDALISSLIPVASQMVCDIVEREFAPVSVGLKRRVKLPSRMANAGVVDFSPWDLQSATLVSLNPETSAPTTLTAGTDYALQPVQNSDGVYTSLRLSAFLNVVSSTLIQFNYALIDITGTWGFPSIPVKVRDACSDAVCAWLRRDVSTLGLQLQDGMQLSPSSVASLDLPLSSIRKVNSYRRNTGAF